MTIADLIDYLQQFDPTHTVVLTDDDITVPDDHVVILASIPGLSD